MATTDASPARQSCTPLHDRTNDAGTTDGVFLPNEHESNVVKRLRQTRSFRQLSFRLDSSDTLPTQPDSIYDAETVGSGNAGSLRQLPGHDLSALSPISIAVPVPSMSPRFPSFHDSELPSPHSRWPTAQLEPIIETRSSRRLRSVSSVPRLRPSPERRSRVVEKKISAHSMRPPAPTPFVRMPSYDESGRHVRSFSLNDLDCFPRSDTKQALPYASNPHSTSSEEALKTVHMCPCSPLEPLHPPPYRSPTPPGLPSFSTREAQEIRLTPPSPPSRVVELLQRWLGRTHDSNEAQHLVNTIQPSSPTLPASQSPSASPPVSILRRVLGVSRIVDSPPDRGHSPRCSLPASIRIASVPGALTQADDGTLVRGRWSGRNSAHGVGQRDLDAHPMLRAAGLGSIDEVVCEIDKACALADAGTDDLQRQMQATRASLEDGTDHDVPTNRGSIAAFSSADSVVSAGRQGGWRASATDGPSSVDLQHPLTGFAPYDSARGDDAAGFRDYVEHGERRLIRQRRAERGDGHGHGVGSGGSGGGGCRNGF